MRFLDHSTDWWFETVGGHAQIWDLVHEPGRGANSHSSLSEQNNGVAVRCHGSYPLLHSADSRLGLHCNSVPESTSSNYNLNKQEFLRDLVRLELTVGFRPPVAELILELLSGSPLIYGSGKRSHTRMSGLVEVRAIGGAGLPSTSTKQNIGVTMLRYSCPLLNVDDNSAPGSKVETLESNSSNRRNSYGSRRAMYSGMY